MERIERVKRRLTSPPVWQGSRKHAVCHSPLGVDGGQAGPAQLPRSEGCKVLSPVHSRSSWGGSRVAGGGCMAQDGSFSLSVVSYCPWTQALGGPVGRSPRGPGSAVGLSTAAPVPLRGPVLFLPPPHGPRTGLEPVLWRQSGGAVESECELCSGGRRVLGRGTEQWGTEQGRAPPGTGRRGPGSRACCSAVPVSEMFDETGQLLQWAVDIYPQNTEHPSPWQPPRLRRAPPHLPSTWHLSMRCLSC